MIPITTRRLDLPADHPAKGNNEDTRNNDWLLDIRAPRRFTAIIGQAGSGPVWMRLYEDYAGRLHGPQKLTFATEAAALAHIQSLS